MAQEWAKAFFHSKEWLEFREAYIISVHGLCEECKHSGYILHHKEKLTPDNINDPSVTLNVKKVKYLCLDCHNRVNAQSVTRDDVMFDECGQLVKSNKAM